MTTHVTMRKAQALPGPAPGRRWLALAVLCVTLLMITLDTTVLNVALLCAGLLVFAAGSAWAAFSGSTDMLIAARASMGIGAAVMMPSTLSLITSIFTDAAQRQRAIGLWAGTEGLGIAIGPIVGGVLLARFWWGSVFLVNVPIALAGFALAVPRLPESRSQTPRRPDYTGAVLSVAGLGLLLWSLIEAPALLGAPGERNGLREKKGNTAMTFIVSELTALEILDSRARPTLAVTVGLADGATARAGVPSGASTGSREAVELRDGDTSRFGGGGVLKAVGNVNGEIADLLRGRTWSSLADADRAMISLDGTQNKARLGANALVGVSMALARALAVSAGTPLWRWLTPPGVVPSLPVPHFNVLNGGVHAPNDLDFQEFMVAPLGAPSMAEAVRAGAEVYAALRRALADRKLSVGLGDEGGFAPEVSEPEEVLHLLVGAIGDAGYRPGADGVSIALDLAASEFRRPDGRYRVAGDLLSSGDLIDRLAAITRNFPVHLIEDGLGEDDEDGWIALTRRLGSTAELVGDDIFCTNPAIISAAIDRGIGNASLIKVNQIGTVTETLEAMAVCRRAGYRQFVSHRSGETEDSFIADLAVGTGCGHLKSGAPARGERTAKYNRLLEIAAGYQLRYGMS